MLQLVNVKYVLDVYKLFNKQKELLNVLFVRKKIGLKLNNNLFKIIINKMIIEYKLIISFICCK